MCLTVRPKVNITILVLHVVVVNKIEKTGPKQRRSAKIHLGQTSLTFLSEMCNAFLNHPFISINFETTPCI